MSDKLTLTEAAIFARRSAFTLRQWAKRGLISYTTVGNQLLFDRRDVEQFLNRGRVEAKDTRRPRRTRAWDASSRPGGAAEA